MSHTTVNPNTILVEPISGAVLQIHGLQHLGGDEAHTCYLTSYTPDETFKKFDNVGGMVFLLKNVGPSSHTMTMQAMQGSRILSIEQLIAGQKVIAYSGICLKKISELDFIELIEIENVPAYSVVAARRLEQPTTNEIVLGDLDIHEDITIS